MGGSAGRGGQHMSGSDTGVLLDCPRAARRSTQLKLRGQLGKEGRSETSGDTSGKGSPQGVRRDPPGVLRQAAAPWGRRSGR